VRDLTGGCGRPAAVDEKESKSAITTPSEQQRIPGRRPCSSSSAISAGSHEPLVVAVSLVDLSVGPVVASTREKQITPQNCSRAPTRC